MSKSGISENVKQLLYESIDSVEQLEVLLFLRQHAAQTWNCEKIAQELRSSANSVMTRLQSLETSGFIRRDPQDHSLCQYVAGTAELEQNLDELSELYKTKRQRVLELIFSPLKKGRHFANAFKVRQDDEGSEDV